MFDLAKWTAHNFNVLVGGGVGDKLQVTFVLPANHLALITGIQIDNGDTVDFESEFQWRGPGVTDFAQLNDNKIITGTSGMILPVDDMVNQKSQMTNGWLVTGPCDVRIQQTTAQATAGNKYIVSWNWLEALVTGALANPVVPTAVSS